ncbi:hypothetical protein [Hymenobacter sp. AT01-02]|uniref:hypothetical protein n=1 Tax=Hymenobacter sp. AT01-02 TaxID=1571877 RepID=UPI0005F270EC|nr:hypothetical protein [Hymenobacter sp. AT01-02]
MSLSLAALIGLVSLPLFQQQPLSTDSLVIFKAGRHYHYRALFVSPAGDTLSRESITLTPSGTPWIGQPSKQTAFSLQFHYTPQDSLTFLAYPNPKSKLKEKPEVYTWSRSIVTGAIENRKEILIHPIRNNQYEHSEVAPFPQIKIPSLQVGGNWNSMTVIMTGWGAFKGTVKSHYEVEKQVPRQYGNLTLADCWLVHAVGRHSKLGTSYLDFYFHPQYGFTEMKYRFYDGTIISFVLEKVTDQP